MLAVTGASGQLGRLVLDALLERHPASGIAALTRSPEKMADFAARGVHVREADYDRPETLETALEGASAVLLISGVDPHRVEQHQEVVDAAVGANVGLLVYTSILNADVNGTMLATDHRATEAAVRASGLPFTFLRNGWYAENYLGALGSARDHGVVLTCAGDGRISAAPRADFAAAAAVVLSDPKPHAGKVYELAGDASFTMDDLAGILSGLLDRPVAAMNMSEEAYAAELEKVGLPAPVAKLLADADSGVSKGWLHDESRTLSRLIGRPTLPIADALRAAR